MKVFTENQALRVLRKLGKQVDANQYCLVEARGNFYVISKDVRKVDLEKYTIKQLGILLA